MNNVYKVLSTRASIDRALARLDYIKGDIILWDHGEEPQQLIKSGEVAMPIAFNGLSVPQFCRTKLRLHHGLGRTGT